MRYVCLLVCTLAAAFAQQYKPGEYELYSEVTKQYAAGDFPKALAALDTWSAKVPETEFLNNRRILYVQTYFALKQPAKAIESAEPLLQNDPAKTFPSPADRLRILYMAVTAIKQLPEPTPPQQSTAKQAATQLAAINQAPQGMSPADWDRARNDLKTAAESALLYIALLPVAQAMKSNDCAAAETAVRKAIEEHPSSVQAAWYQGSALLCLARQKPERTSEAIYAFARAAALDPVKGMVDPKWQQTTVTPYLEKLYSQYHGKDPEALAQLKAQSIQSVTPPAGFHIPSAAEIAHQKQADFESRNPELALWKRIHDALTAPNGEQYFESDLKNSELPPLRGTSSPPPQPATQRNSRYPSKAPNPKSFSNSKSPSEANSNPAQTSGGKASPLPSKRPPSSSPSKPRPPKSTASSPPPAPPRERSANDYDFHPHPPPAIIEDCQAPGSVQWAAANPARSGRKQR